MRDPTAETALANILRDERRELRGRGKRRPLTHSESIALADAKRLIEAIERLK